MSFTQNIKAQLARIESDCDFCDIAELAAIVRLCTVYRDGRVIISTENEDVAERARSLYGRVFCREAEYSERNGVFRLYPETDFFLETAALRLRLFESSAEELTRRACCRAAYVRGAFLGGGSMSDPKTCYHMEFDTKHGGYAAQLKAVLGEMDIPAKITCRKNRYIVYIKEYGAIADVLGAMGAVGAAMDLYNISIEKEIRNTVNRQANCEIANIEKTTKTASLQLEAIRKIDKYMGFDRLPETLREIAALRAEYPEDSLKELGERLTPPLGKSGVNHRLKRIMEIAANL